MTPSVRHPFRAEIILRRAEGVKQKGIAERMATSVTSVNRASQRFEQHRVGGLISAPGPGRKRRIHPAIVDKVVSGASQTPPGGTRERSRTMARTTGHSHLMVERTGRGKQLKPYRINTFKPSQDANLEKEFRNVIDPYVDPPKRPSSCFARVHRCQVSIGYLPVGCADARRRIGCPSGTGPPWLVRAGTGNRCASRTQRILRCSASL